MTVRDRDTTEQDRIPAENVGAYIDDATAAWTAPAHEPLARSPVSGCSARQRPLARSNRLSLRASAKQPRDVKHDVTRSRRSARDDIGGFANAPLAPEAPGGLRRHRQAHDLHCAAPRRPSAWRSGERRSGAAPAAPRRRRRCRPLSPAVRAAIAGAAEVDAIRRGVALRTRCDRDDDQRWSSSEPRNAGEKRTSPPSRGRSWPISMFCTPRVPPEAGRPPVSVR